MLELARNQASVQGSARRFVSLGSFSLPHARPRVSSSIGSRSLCFRCSRGSPLGRAFARRVLGDQRRAPVISVCSVTAHWREVRGGYRREGFFALLGSFFSQARSHGAKHPRAVEGCRMCNS